MKTTTTTTTKTCPKTKGRPPISENDRRVPLVISVPGATKTAFLRKCRELGMDRGKLFIELMSMFLAEKRRNRP